MTTLMPVALFQAFCRSLACLRLSQARRSRQQNFNRRPAYKAMYNAAVEHAARRCWARRLATRIRFTGAISFIGLQAERCRAPCTLPCLELRAKLLRLHGDIRAMRIDAVNDHI